MPTGPSTIILIDDDASVLRALGRVMASAGLVHAAFESAEAFLEVVPSPEIQCLVVDLTMPGMNGLELKQQLNLSHPNLPVIFLTAHDNPEMRAAAREAGAVAYFRKPVDTQALLDAIHWALGMANSATPA